MKEQLSKKLLYSFVNIDSEGNIAIPREVFFLKNYIFTREGALKRFNKLNKVININEPHSLYPIGQDTYLLCAINSGLDNLYLYDRNANLLRLIGTLGNSYRRTWYATVHDVVYISNKNYKYMFKNYRLFDWIPATIKQFSEVNEASDYLFTDVIEMPNCENLCVFHGRVFGSNGNRVWFTEPIFCSFTKDYNFLEFPDRVVSLASTKDSLLICLTNSFYLANLANAENFTLNIKLLGNVSCIPYTAVSYKDLFVFLCREGIILVKEGSYTLINKDFVRMKILGEGNVHQINDGVFLFGDNNMDIEFADNIQATLIKNN